jgi:hypothetical protein
MDKARVIAPLLLDGTAGLAQPTIGNDPRRRANIRLLDTVWQQARIPPPRKEDSGKPIDL